MSHTNKNGFSLVEILVYLGILSIIAITFFRILGVSTRVQVSQVAANEVANQTNFVLQTIQRLVRESSAIMVSNVIPCTDTPNTVNDGGALLGTDQTCLMLRMRDSDPSAPGSRDPIFIWLEPTGVIRMQEGAEEPSDLTTDKVLDPNNALIFRKYTNYPGQDTVEVSLTLNYSSGNPQAQAKHTAQTSVSRVSAATFDSPLLSGTSQFGTTFDIGQSAQRWANAFVTNLDVSGNITQSNNYNGGNRGFFIVAGAPGQNCSTICSGHTGQCGASFQFIDPNGDNAFEVNPLLSCSSPLAGIGGMCFCY